MKKLLLIVMMNVALFAGLNNGDKAINFNLPTLDNTANYTMKDFQGEVILLNIWASWCAGCKQEMPEFFKLQKSYPKGFKIVAISIDSSARTSSSYLAMMEEEMGYKTPFVALHDLKKDTPKAYGANAMPSSFLIDKNGVIRDIIIGSLNAEDMVELKKEIDSLMR